ncbi:immunoglobulin lambda-1 light chain-like [Hypomesus transpacificus]|uniref:immunoglobulin lambda-1 light chain-like n=1 Tax=Hypomesus transpacificus TaxID=137520 RepID=UPI001F075CEA|nr:immunoglobulin lambda-1 light chain-like [Hypomesus transpacificus]
MLGNYLNKQRIKARWTRDMSQLKGMGHFTVNYVFGPGTRLYVTDKNVKEPQVTSYQAPKNQTNKRTTLLCQARDMFPDLVTFSWKMEREDGRLVEVPEAEREELEQREDGRVTSMIIIKNEEVESKKYSCTVKHEVAVADITKKLLQSMCSVNLVSLVYTVMIVKSLVYCCGLSLLLLLRDNKGSPPHTQRNVL